MRGVWGVLLLTGVLVLEGAVGGSVDPLKERGSVGRVDLEGVMARGRERLGRERGGREGGGMVRENGCNSFPTPPNAPPLPEVPNSFMTDIEMATITNTNQKAVMNGREMYDSTSERGVIEYQLVEGIFLTRPYLLAELIHYSIPMDQALFILTNADCAITGEEECNRIKACTAGTITDMGSELEGLFGIINTGNGEQFLGAVGLLGFGSQFNYTAQDLEQTCRGVDCDVYQTCLYDVDADVTLMYTYYWSNANWNMQNNKEQVPIAVDIYANGKFGGQTLREVATRVDYFDFRREWIPSRYQLEPPADVYCYGKKNLLSPPKPVSMFSYRSELVTSFTVYIPDGDNQTTPSHLKGMYAQKEWYDWEMRITRKSYLPFFIFGMDHRFENLTWRIQDFNQGLSYHVRPRQSYCHIGYIENITDWGDVIVGDDGSVQMQNPWNFEDLSEPMQYNGVHWERGLQADVWVGIKENPLLKINETIVWYFASPLTHEVLGGDLKDLPQLPTADKVPVKLEKYLTAAEGLPHSIFNIYDYDSKIPTTHRHDISSCYDSTQMRHFTFDLPQDALNQSLYLRENLKYALLGSLKEAAMVSPLRINRLEIKETPTSVQVLFTLLEKVDVVGDVVGEQFESSMNEAATYIRKNIDNSQLVVLVKIGNNELEPIKSSKKMTTIASLVALPGTMKEVSRDNGSVSGTTNYTGYSSGAMAGMAFGMLALGGILGFVGLYFTKK